MLKLFRQPRPRRLPVAALLLWLLPALSAGAQAQDDDPARQREQLQQLQEEMAELNKMLKQFRGERSKLQEALRNSEVDIGELQKRIHDIQKKLEQQQSELQQLQQRREALRDAQRAQQQQIAEQVRGAYQLGRQKKLKVLLNQEQPDKINRALTYYDYFNRARAEQIEAYIDIISELDQVEPAIIEKTRALQTARNQLNREHRELTATRQRRESNLAKLNATIRTKDQELKQLAADRAELERLLAAVEQTLAHIKIPSSYQPFASLKGKLPWPVEGRRRNAFGAHRDGSQLRWHGINIAARAGDPVRAVHHGRVVFADWFRGSGLLVILDHGDGYMSLYAHNQSLLVEAGDWVNAGESIATVGNSGGREQAALYFEIRHNGEPTDPIIWCS